MSQLFRAKKGVTAIWSQEKTGVTAIWSPEILGHSYLNSENARLQLFGGRK